MKKNLEKKLLVVVPMKDLKDAKSRLNGTLNGKERELLAKLLFLRTLTILDTIRSNNKQFFDIGVVTKSFTIKKLIKELNISLINEKNKGLNLALQDSYLWASQKNYKFLAILPADLADPNPDEILSFLKHYTHSEKPTVALSPSNDLGTNAMLLSIPSKLRFCFGQNSFLKHSEACKNLGILPKILPFASLRNDVDTRRDFERIRHIKVERSKS